VKGDKLSKVAERGSEWRRWDLHVHTASSYDYDYNSEDADSVLADTLIMNKVSAVAITDHFVIDKTRIESLRTLAPGIVFFPGVELRTDKGDTNIHVVLIFDDRINLDELVEDFSVFRRIEAKNPNDDDKIYWDYSHIVKFAKVHNALISIHAGSKTAGVDDKISNKLEVNQAIKEDYAKTVDIFEMGKIDDLEGYRTHVFPNIGGERPMVICSDNHDPRHYDSKARMWIKADVTFNGLKQILYEPAERICFSDTKPEEKPDYLVIDRIEIGDADFQDEPVFFNDKLTCIIGGKSTGKSILLHNLALTLDKEQTDERDLTSNTRTKKDVVFTVHWADGVKNNPENTRKIIYVPQTYLNKLCDEQTEKTEIDKLIEDIVLTDSDAKKVFAKMSSSIKEHKLELTKKISDLLEAHTSIISFVERMKELGDKDGISKEKDKLILEKQHLSEMLSLEETDIKAYEEATSRIAILANEMTAIDDEITALNDIGSLVEPINFKYRFSDDVREKLNSLQSNIAQQAVVTWTSSKDELISTLKTLYASKQSELIKQQEIEESLRVKVQSNKAIAELTERIKSESNKLSEFENLEKYRSEKMDMINGLLGDLVASANYFREQHKIFSNVVNAKSDIKTNDLSFSVVEPFRLNAFLDKMKSIFDTGRKSFKDTISPDEFSEVAYTTNKLTDIINKLLIGELVLKKNYTLESALRDILDDWYETKYKVTMGADSIDVMSPGKKALVLLKLLIELAESKCPILIDQPEDDLDNRSVFDELIPFIRRKKKERQIIIVSHNANIVVGADAEAVIVANQRGENAPNRKKRFEYRAGSIENNTFLLASDGTIQRGILNSQGIQQHIRDILEGGEEAFKKRKQKYHM